MKRKQNLILKLYWRYIILLIALAIQHIIIYIHIYTNKTVGIKGFVVVLLMELVIPIGYILNRTVSLLVALLWACIYTAWLFTFVDTPSFIAKTVIFTIPTPFP